ncbi:MAG: 50S ribosomal protein L3 [Thermodesulfobacteriota bacterium]
MEMIEGLIGRKLGMTETFLDNGIVEVVTAIKAGPCYVVQMKTTGTDGYEALQLGFEELKAQRVSKPIAGHFKSAGTRPLRVLREFSLLSGDIDDYNLGDVIKADIFKDGDIVDVYGKSKGKGFAGVMKRHGFSGQPDSHGGMSHRRPGSIGQHSWPSRVWKGMKMAGHMGDRKVSVQGLTVVKVDPENDILLIRGSVPGPNGSVVVLKHTTKRRN